MSKSKPLSISLKHKRSEPPGTTGRGKAERGRSKTGGGPPGERTRRRPVAEAEVFSGPGSLVTALPTDLKAFQRTLRFDKVAKPPVVHENNPEWKGFRLDDFQVEAIGCLDAGKDCLVAAHTGNGKTLIADYLVDRAMREGRRVFYTAPIKALSNQKFRDYCHAFGEANVGLLTGDHQINRYAPILVMTTEIFRNMLIEKDIPGELSHVVFDEIHYLNDPERGAVWEECLILMPPQVRLLGLSATVPNIVEIADWLGLVHERDVPVVTFLQRHVPLAHFYYQRQMGLGTARQAIKVWSDAMEPPKDFKEQTERAKAFPAYGQGRQPAVPPTSHRQLVACLASMELLPAIYFLFSRNGCEQAAMDWQGHTFLDEAETAEAELIIAEVEARLGAGLQATQMWPRMRRMLLTGVAYHHAGLPPVVKQAVEEVFGRGRVRVLYATETFAVGINYPVKTVCMDTTTKFDGSRFRVMTGTEYHQMAGRAGRRGMDRQGLVIVRADYQHFSEERFPDWTKRYPEPIRSRFALSFNSVVNLAAHHSDEQVDKILTHNFKAYQEMVAIRQAQSRMAELQQTPILARCHFTGLDACPVERKGLEKELQRTEQRLKTWGQHKSIGPRVREKIESAKLRKAELQKLLGGLPRIKCDRQSRVLCAERVKKTASFVQAYQAAEEKKLLAEGRIDEIRASYNRMVDYLTEHKYLDEASQQLPRGMVLGKLHVEELLVTEWIFEGLLHEVSDGELAALIGGVVLEDGRFDPHIASAAKALGDWVLRARELFFQLRDRVPDDLPQPHFRIEGCWFLKTLVEARDFTHFLALSGMAEGDAIALARRCMDVLRQLARAVEGDEGLQKKIRRAAELVARPEVVAGL
ncbi:DEAD/DEAH box helicase [Heliophilum fasciatum]|uniref:ATP-dependent RNA helicase HelY n=1 Tax=Heliophilum fasciatum TaxID=35700 RepID=A0A4R2RVB2_9FIRM|nr:DEAD/DEAH box helicase [Heliophilum fasciatum]MCW2278246.1 ATP-dependent RNA helicase HelY [Heliophilum fasciatum]TCP63871.1 ATP-dependent RNA helicase HelY [Heliophilum fasciatum]